MGRPLRSVLRGPLRLKPQFVPPQPENSEAPRKSPTDAPEEPVKRFPKQRAESSFGAAQRDCQRVPSAFRKLRKRRRVESSSSAAQFFTSVGGPSSSPGSITKGANLNGENPGEETGTPALVKTCTTPEPRGRKRPLKDGARSPIRTAPSTSLGPSRERNSTNEPIPHRCELPSGCADSFGSSTSSKTALFARGGILQGVCYLSRRKSVCYLSRRNSSY